LTPWYILIAFILGVIYGLFGTLPLNIVENVIEGSLLLMVFIVGFEAAKMLKKSGFLTILRAGLRLTVATIIGSAMGGFFAALILGLEPRLGLAIALGMGWYSMAGPLLMEAVDVETGVLGFLANFLREILTFLFYPYLAKKFSAKASITVAGATSMDTTLPVIIYSGGSKIATIALVHGFLTTLLAPLLIELALLLPP